MTPVRAKCPLIVPPTLLIGVDLGTSATKAGLYKSDGTLLHRRLPTAAGLVRDGRLDLAPLALALVSRETGGRCIEHLNR